MAKTSDTTQHRTIHPFPEPGASCAAGDRWFGAGREAAHAIAMRGSGRPLLHARKHSQRAERDHLARVSFRLEFQRHRAVAGVLRKPVDELLVGIRL